jgi:NADPH2:quinone reductase
LKIRACGLNFADLLQIKGQYQERIAPPFVPGMEICGVVDAIGDGVDGLEIGQRVVCVPGHGGLATHTNVAASICTPVPDALSDAQAAGFQIAYGTSHLALERRARLQKGECVVVLGAAGGVGLTAVEIAHVMGAKVIAVARGAHKLEIARKAGADVLIDADVPDLKQQLRKAGPVHVVYDAVGGALGEAALGALEPEGRFLVIGFASGDIPQVKLNHLLVKNIDVSGFYWGGYTKFNHAALRDSMRTLLDWAAEGRITPHVSHELPLDQAEDGLELLRSRKATGKVVITP